jgi:hypothetical protein
MQLPGDPGGCALSPYLAAIAPMEPRSRTRGRRCGQRRGCRASLVSTMGSAREEGKTDGDLKALGCRHSGVVLDIRTGTSHGCRGEISSRNGAGVKFGPSDFPCRRARRLSLGVLRGPAASEKCTAKSLLLVKAGLISPSGCPVSPFLGLSQAVSLPMSISSLPTSPVGAGSSTARPGEAAQMLAC